MEFFVGIDSDGCAFDTMEIKHKECFIPNIINSWDLQSVSRFARQAAEEGYDIVAGYGGDGTQHEIANGIMGTGAPHGVLPGGTGNGFANEMGIPGKLRPALEVLCTSENVRNVDIVQMDGGYFIQRLYVGIEPEQQTSRES